jgi:hypothetical protein
VSDSASLKVALVGPSHPYKGGVAAHTTALAHELTEAGCRLVPILNQLGEWAEGNLLRR